MGVGMKIKLRTLYQLFRDAAVGWRGDMISMHGAALAYYTIFSVAPILVIAIGIAGLVFGTDASRHQIFRAVEGLVGPAGAQGIESLVASAARRPHLGKITAWIGLAALFLGASGVFQQLQTSFNVIWRVSIRPGKGLWVFLRRRLLTFSMVFAIGFLLLVTLLISAAISGLSEYLRGSLPGGEVLWQVAHLAFSFGVTVLLFAALLKILPDVHLRWRDVWLGSAVTALLFSLGKLLIGLYLGHSAVVSSYGAAGSLVVVIVWVYYASQIVFFGAEFIRAYARYMGRTITAKDGAVLLGEPVQEIQGKQRAA
jgi:membrane protein